MGFLKEFKEFAVKGNVIDMAVGIIIGAAFGKIVTSLVNDVIMPPIGVIVGGVDFTDLKIKLKSETVNEAGETIAAVTVNYGNFLQGMLDFLIIAFAIFLLIKGINKLKKKAEDPKNTETPTPMDIQLLSEIRDLLKSGANKE